MGQNFNPYKQHFPWGESKEYLENFYIWAQNSRGRLESYQIWCDNSDAGQLRVAAKWAGGGQEQLE